MTVRTFALGILLTLAGCAGQIDWGSELDKTKLGYRPAMVKVEAMRDLVREDFQCPADVDKAYVLAEINLRTNATRAVIRCQ